MTGDLIFWGDIMSDAVTHLPLNCYRIHEAILIVMSRRHISDSVLIHSEGSDSSSWSSSLWSRCSTCWLKVFHISDRWPQKPLSLMIVRVLQQWLCSEICCDRPSPSSSFVNGGKLAEARSTALLANASNFVTSDWNPKISEQSFQFKPAPV